MLAAPVLWHLPTGGHAACADSHSQSFANALRTSKVRKPSQPKNVKHRAGSLSSTTETLAAMPCFPGGFVGALCVCGAAFLLYSSDTRGRLGRTIVCSLGGGTIAVIGFAVGSQHSARKSWIFINGAISNTEPRVLRRSPSVAP